LSSLHLLSHAMLTLLSAFSAPAQRELLFSSLPTEALLGDSLPVEEEEEEDESEEEEEEETTVEPEVEPKINPCAGAKPKDATFTDGDGNVDPSRTIPYYFDNKDCAEMMDHGFGVMLPQSGMDVTGDGEYGDLDYSGVGLFEPILTNYEEAGLCAVNVHWHLGAEHRSEGQFDENGSGPPDHHRALAGGADVRLGLQCHYYDEEDSIYTTPYEWEYCKGMEVGQTYEIHWPHSAAGDCGTEWQYQYPFYVGVFCKPDVISLGDSPPFNVNKKIGVEGQVFVIVNSDDEVYQNDDLFDGAWKDATHWQNVATYIGSTTGTSRDNEVCSFYAPITWKVDRICHQFSAKSVDLMCKKMLEQPDDMEPDVWPHGARELVLTNFTSANMYRK